ncbi:MAG: SLC13 family permease, partial [Anaerolineae bacterium]
SSSAVITILAISIIAEGLQQSGVTYRLGQRMKRLAGQGERQLVTVVMLTGATLSLFMNNIAAVAVLLPATMGLARRLRVPPSRLLMPLAYGVISGGMATLFTTSNLIASGVLRDAGVRPFGVLDFLPVGLMAVLGTVLYMLFLGRHLLPTRRPAEEISAFHRQREELLRMYGMEKSLWEVLVLPGSAMAGLSIREGRWRTVLRLNVLGISRDGTFLSAPDAETLIREGDVLLVQGEPSEEKLRDYGLRLMEKPSPLTQAAESESALAEVVLAPHSALVGKTLREIHFREKFNLTVLALWRNGRPIHIGFASMPLQVGDGLLVQGAASNLRMLYRERDFIILEEDPEAILRPAKARLATVIGLTTLAIAMFSHFPIALVALGGAIALILTGCLSMDDAYRAIEWKAVFLIAGMWPLGTAIQTSGLGEAIASELLTLGRGAHPLYLAAILLVTAMILANLTAGQAAAPIVLAPIGLSLARVTGVDPRALLMAVALGCSLAYPTPIGHPVNAIVMGSGGYTFRDFLRVGWALTLLLIPLILLGLHLFWGL